MRNLTSSLLQKRHVSDKAYFRPQLYSRRQITCSGIAQLSDSISVSHAIFSLLKTLILSYNPLRVGVQPNLKHFNKTLRFGPRREAGDVWCLPPVWNLRAVIWFQFAISSLVLLPSPVTLSVLSFSACWPFLVNFFQKILQYFSLRDRLFCMAPV